MAKNKQYGIDKDGLPPRGRTMEQQKRIDKAREHYLTRSERRPKGQSQSDWTKYYLGHDGHMAFLNGTRRVPRDTLNLIYYTIKSPERNALLSER